MKLYLLFVLVLQAALSVAQLKLEVPALMRKAHYGALVVELQQGDTVLAHNANASFAPASLTKLVTTASALQLLGPRHTYTTTLSYTGSVQQGTVVGDLIVKGSGDPTLGSEYVADEPLAFLDTWVAQLQNNGIASIAGDLIVDASVFDAKVLGDKWIWEDVGNYYGAGVYGLSFMDNRYYLALQSAAVGDVAKVVDVQPSGLDLDFDCTVLAADDHRDNAYIYGSPWTLHRKVRGSIPAHRDRFVIKGAMPNPPLVFAQLFKRRLEASGIRVLGELWVDWKGLERSTTQLSTCESPKVADIIAITNKNSNNLFAEHLLKTLALGDAPAGADKAIARVMSYWQGQGLVVDGLKLYDGSGLSRANLLTPAFVVGVLDVMSASAYAEAFEASLAVAGHDGTFKYFLENTPLELKVKGKSGGMSGVRCYAGYTRWDAKHYAFCVMVNNSTASMAEMKAAIEDYLLQIWQ